MIRVVVCHPVPYLLRLLVTDLRAADDLAIAGTGLNGADALTLVRRYDPDVLVADRWLGDCSGLDLGRRLAAEQRRTRVLLLSEDLGIASTVEALRHGIHVHDDVIGVPSDIARYIAR